MYGILEISSCPPLVLTRVLQTPIKSLSLGKIFIYLGKIFIYREKVLSH